MSDEVIKFPRDKPPELLVGPFEEWRVVVQGRFVPWLTGFREGDKIWLVVDRRFAAGFSSEEDAHNAATLIAEGMAIASGYSHFAADSKDMPFAMIATEIKP